MSRFSRYLSKAEKLAAASDVVKHLGDLETTLNCYCTDKPIHNLLSGKPRGTVFPDGYARLSLEPKADWTKSASNHAKIEMMQIVSRANAAFEGAAAGLSTLLPGIPLDLGLDFEWPVRYWLSLGIEKSGSSVENYVIWTTRRRWKAPLVRLSDFLESSEFREIQGVGKWHFPTMFPTSETEVVRRVSSKAVTARCLSEAMRLVSFKDNLNTASPEPRRATLPLAFELGTLTQTSSIALAYEDARETREVEINSAMEALKHRLSAPMDHLNAAIDTLQVELGSTLTLNLIKDEVHFTALDHPLAADVDMASAFERRTAVEMAARPICTALSQELHRFHPDLRQAEIVVRISTSMNDDPTERSWTAHIDGLKRTTQPSNIHGLIRDAAWTAWAHRPGPVRRFIVSSPPDQEVVPINAPSTVILVQAVSPEQAWLLHQDRQNTSKVTQGNPVIYEIHPVSRADFERETYDVARRIEKTYPKKSK